MRLVIKRLARVVTVAAIPVASSGSMASGRPLFVMLGDAAFELTVGFLKSKRYGESY